MTCDAFEVAKFVTLQRRQRKRIFQRMVTGIYYNRRVRLRFLTLTSAPDSPPLRKSWGKFVQEVRRKYKGKRFEYFAVFTDEGCGVIHAVFVGEYIPFSWIQEKWKTYHDAYHVNIKIVGEVYSSSGLAGYFVSQYLGGQNYIRWHNHSKGWVYPGFQKDWAQLKRLHPKMPMRDLVKLWHIFLDEKYSVQQSLL